MVRIAIVIFLVGSLLDEVAIESQLSGRWNETAMPHEQISVALGLGGHCLLLLCCVLNNYAHAPICGVVRCIGAKQVLIRKTPDLFDLTWPQTAPVHNQKGSVCAVG